jgi:5-formyltetrahydrofolate cyclo-ligase
MINKAEYRKIYKQKRLLLSEAAFSLLENQLQKNVFQYLTELHIKTVLAYYPITKQKEPNIFNLLASNENFKVYLPKINDQNLHAIAYTKENLKPGNWGLTEPAGKEITNYQILDAVLVPLLCADKQGNRVGYGKGYYDRFIAKHNLQKKAIGISLFEPLDNLLETDEWDVPLKKLITPTKVYEFK